VTAALGVDLAHATAMSGLGTMTPW
jgi:hypothetical protein